LDTLRTSHVLRSFDSLLGEKRQRIDQLTESMGRCVREQTNREGMRLDRASIRLEHGMSDRLGEEKRRFAQIAAKMEAYDPFAVIARGYAIAEKEDGTLVRSVSAVKKNDPLTVTVEDGKILCTVDGTTTK
ncbi:MAG: hypothetical protein J6Y62_07630, partial [Clostridia bacterium]|nr:hypothetical protein [Clostridia bacterium]